MGAACTATSGPSCLRSTYRNRSLPQSTLSGTTQLKDSQVERMGLGPVQLLMLPALQPLQQSWPQAVGRPRRSPHTRLLGFRFPASLQTLRLLAPASSCLASDRCNPKHVENDGHLIGVISVTECNALKPRTCVPRSPGFTTYKWYGPEFSVARDRGRLSPTQEDHEAAGPASAHSLGYSGSCEPCSAVVPLKLKYLTPDAGILSREFSPRASSKSGKMCGRRPHLRQD